jgi:hypothetical protein
MAQNQNKSLSRTKLGVIIGIVGFGLSYFVSQQFFYKSVSFDKTMMEAASELNKTCPVMIDKETRLDNTATAGNVFNYNFTLVNVSKSEISIDTIKKYTEPGLINNVKTNPDLKIFRDNNITLEYNYRDKDGVFVMKISVTPDMYATE